MSIKLLAVKAIISALILTPGITLAEIASSVPTPTFNLADIPYPSGQWTYVTTDIVKNAEISVDINTGIRQGNFVRFWQRRIARVPNQNGVLASLHYESVDCSKGVWRFHKNIYFDRRGNILEQNEGNSPLQNAIPGSVGGEVFQLVCY